MLSKFFTVSLAVAALSQAAFAETAANNSGFEIRGGASFAYGDYHYDHEGHVYDFNVTELGSFLSAGYRFRFLGLYLDSGFVHYSNNLSKEGRDDIGNPKGWDLSCLDLSIRLFIPIIDQLAFVPHVGGGLGGQGLDAKAGAGFDFKLNDHLFVTAEASYIGSAAYVVGSGRIVRTNLGVGYNF